MKRRQKIEQKIKENFQIESLEVKDNSHLHKGHAGSSDKGETHFEIIIKSRELKNISKIEAHRKINKALKDEFCSGLHALEIKII